LLSLSVSSPSSFPWFFLRVWRFKVLFPALRFELPRRRETLASVAVDEETGEEAGEVAGEVTGEAFDAFEMIEACESGEIDDDSEALFGAISS
jgi:hypothetical protein